MFLCQDHLNSIQILISVHANKLNLSAKLYNLFYNSITDCHFFEGDSGYFPEAMGGVRPVPSLTAYVGYARDTVSAKDFRQRQTIVMHGKSVMIKETKIRAPRVSQRGDTLTYLVNSFRQKQDRTITDVIKKMPGLQVGEDGTLTYTIKKSHKTAIY